MGTAEIPPGIKKESQVKVAAQEAKKKEETGCEKGGGGEPSEVGQSMW